MTIDLIVKRLDDSQNSFGLNRGTDPVSVIPLPEQHVQGDFFLKLPVEYIPDSSEEWVIQLETKPTSDELPDTCLTCQIELQRTEDLIKTERNVLKMGLRVIVPIGHEVIQKVILTERKVKKEENYRWKSASRRRKPGPNLKPK